MTIKDLKPGEIVSYENYEDGVRCGTKYVTMLVNNIIFTSDEQPEFYDSTSWAFKDFEIDKRKVNKIVGQIPAPSY